MLTFPSGHRSRPHLGIPLEEVPKAPIADRYCLVSLDPQSQLFVDLGNSDMSFDWNDVPVRQRNSKTIVADCNVGRVVSHSEVVGEHGMASCPRLCSACRYIHPSESGQACTFSNSLDKWLCPEDIVYARSLKRSQVGSWNQNVTFWLVRLLATSFGLT